MGWLAVQWYQSHQWIVTCPFSHSSPTSLLKNLAYGLRYTDFIMKQGLGGVGPGRLVLWTIIYKVIRVGRRQLLKSNRLVLDFIITTSIFVLNSIYLFLAYKCKSQNSHRTRKVINIFRPSSKYFEIFGLEENAHKYFNWGEEVLFSGQRGYSQGDADD